MNALEVLARDIAICVTFGLEVTVNAIMNYAFTRVSLERKA